MRNWLFLLVVFGHTSAMAQPNWGSTGHPGFVWSAGVLATTAGEDTLFYAGSLGLGGDWNLTNQAIYYTNGEWDTIPGIISGNVRSIIQYHDTLIIGGTIDILNGQPAANIAYFDGALWQPYGSLGSAVHRFRVIEDTLYAIGGFNDADGIPVTGVVKRVGNSWIGVGFLEGISPFVLDIAKYNGDLIIASNATVNGVRSMFHLVDGVWLPLGTGIFGGLSTAGTLAVFQNSLYIGGNFSPNQGNAGTGVMRWDGTSYHGVGLGIERVVGTGTTTCGSQIILHNDLIWVIHGCMYAGGVESRGVATWDGIQWCGVPGDIQGYNDGGAARIAFYKDTLFASLYGDYVEDSIYVNRLTKFVGPTYFGECSGPVGTAEIDQNASKPTLQSLGTDQWSVVGLREGLYDLSLVNVQGQVVRSRPLSVSGEVSERINTYDFLQGIYLLRIKSRAAPYTTVGLKLVLDR